mmetsp:Transcript_31140/g.73404  ORF Transcript_31140/g.73404 Transcript_31140/m.73404 type:complete len:245 (+) Transcript_31140:186-920(+)
MITIKYHLAFVWTLFAALSINAFTIDTTTGRKSNNFNRRHDRRPPLSLSSLAQLVDEPVAWNAVIGEADRAFRRGTQLEKSGQPRLASGAFHEAATLFQCFLELPENFEHVTDLSKKDCQAVISYTLVRLGFLNSDSLSDANAAVRLYTMAVEIDPFPSPESFKGIGTSLEATGGNGKNLDHLEQAVEAYRAALRKSNKTLVLFYMGVALERLGKTEEAAQILESIQRSEAVTSCMSDSWGYVR